MLLKDIPKNALLTNYVRLKELRKIGVEIYEEYEKQLINSMEALRQQRLSFNKKLEDKLNTLCRFEGDENFAMILGYTSGGFPYGVTHEEMEKINTDKYFE